MGEYYILDGKTVVPCEDVIAWGRWLQENPDKRRVALTKTSSGRVSTVFLGLGHSLGEGPPLIFETMIFGGEQDGYQDRCSTWEQAEAMHEKACALVGSAP